MKLSKNKSIKSVLNEDDICLIVVLVDWCGYCIEFKESGILKEISKEYKVIELDEHHKESDIVRKYVKAKTYPTVCIFKRGKLSLFKKNRTLKNIKEALGKI